MGHLISAILTPDAFAIYESWKNERRGGHMISFVICKHENEKKPLLAAGRREVELEANIRGLQKHLTLLHCEVDELMQTISDLYCPQKPQ